MLPKRSSANPGFGSELKLYPMRRVRGALNTWQSKNDELVALYLRDSPKKCEGGDFS
jgi:hypothetical protein